MSSGLDFGDLGGLNITFCPPPFISAADFPSNTGGYIRGRYCGDLSGSLSCCLPCPLEKVVYSDRFNHLMQVSHWLNIPSLALQCLLLLTFVILPEGVGHRNYLGVGLCISIIMLQLGFLLPLGTKPDMCHDPITPNDMYSSMSCAWTGALLVTGAMACAVWVMLRSLWTHLRICWDFQHQETFFWVAQVLGWGLPGLFLALTLPITGVSYRLGPSCVPNQKNSFVTWFGWLIAFGCIAALLTTTTTCFCLWVYLKDLGRQGKSGKGTSTNKSGPESADDSVAPNTESGWTSRNSTRKLAWSRVKKVLLMQWRSMLLSTLVIVMVMYYGTVFVKQTNTEIQATSEDQREGLTNWAVCMVLNQGDKNQCPTLSGILGLDENVVIAAWFIAGLVGTFTFLLMFRRSMIGGWWFLIRHPRHWKRTESVGGQDFFIIPPKPKAGADPQGETQRISFGPQLQSEKHLTSIHTAEDADGDTASLNEIDVIMPPHIAGGGGGGGGMYAMSPISPVSPISPILSASRFGSSTALNEQQQHTTTQQQQQQQTPNAAPGVFTPGIIPDIEGGSGSPRRSVADVKESGIQGQGQTRWSASTTSEGGGDGGCEAGDVSRRRETTNLFEGGDQIGVARSGSDGNGKVNNGNGNGHVL